MKLDRFFLLGIGLLVAVFFVLSAYLNNPNFPEESVSAIFNLTNRLGSFSINNISPTCGQNFLPQVSLSWTSPGRVNSYMVQRKASNASFWTILGATEQTSLVDSNWTGNYQAGLYQYRVIASNDTRSSTSKSASVRVPSCAAPQTPSPPLTATSSAVLWGAYAGDQISDAADFESQVGKKINLQAIFVGFGDPFPSEFKTTVGNQGKTLIIFWEPYSTSLDAINAGNSDSYIKQFAVAAKTYGAPVILAPLHEANGDWDPWGGTIGSNTPAKVIAAWKKIYGLFAGVTNVKFGWAINNESVPDTTANKIENYYPGDAYVDYVGVDGFNFADPWQSFSQVFDNALTRIEVYKKPIYIFSFASAQGTQKAVWITDALKTQIPKHPQIAGWIWFNQNKEMDWRVWSDSAALAAFKNSLP